MKAEVLPQRTLKVRVAVLPHEQTLRLMLTGDDQEETIVLRVPLSAASDVPAGLADVEFWERCRDGVSVLPRDIDLQPPRGTYARRLSA